MRWRFCGKCLDLRRVEALVGHDRHLLLRSDGAVVCGLGYDDIECTPPASSSSWALYTLVLLPLTGLCKHLAELRMERAERRKGARSGLWLPLVPSIMNYVVGWAAGEVLGPAQRQRLEAEEVGGTWQG